MEFLNTASPISGLAPVSNQSANPVHRAQIPAESTSFSEVLKGQEVEPGKTRQASAKQDKALHELAVVITQQFIGEIMKDQISIGVEEGLQADFHKTVFVKAVAEQLASTDALGIRQFVENGVGEI